MRAEPVRQGALVLLNGELSCPGLVRRLATAVACVVCADGGARHAARLGIRPSVVIGDMDSFPKRHPSWPGTTYLCDFDEDRSDFEKALGFVGSLGLAPVWVAGAFGRRLDHTLVNLSLVETYARSLMISLVHEGLAWLARPGRHVLECLPGQVLSLIPTSEDCRLTTRGLRYPLRRETLARGSRGLSNVAAEERVEVEVHRGAVWIVRPDMPTRPDKAPLAR